MSTNDPTDTDQESKTKSSEQRETFLSAQSRLQGLGSSNDVGDDHDSFYTACENRATEYKLAHEDPSGLLKVEVNKNRLLRPRIQSV